MHVSLKSRWLFAALAPFALGACATVESADPAPSTPAFGGVVASADPRASAAGEEILARGGSATDAAIAVMIALTVVEPQSSGIGGGGFIVRGAPDGQVETFDGRETAPAAADESWFLDDEGDPRPFSEVVQTGLSVGVPSNIAVAKLAHDKHGKLPWADLFAPSIRLAAEGFLMNQRLFESLGSRSSRASADPLMKEIFFLADGEPKPVGTRIIQPELAQSLTMLAEQGPDWLYKGEQARALAKVIADATPGDAKMTTADVEGYQAKERVPVCGDYRGYRVCSMGPPSSGAFAVIGILKQLERFDLAALGPKSPKAWHLFVESQRLAFADRERYTGDSDFVDIPVAGLVDANYLASRSMLIDPTKRAETVEAGTPPGAVAPPPAGEGYPDSGTSHLSVVGPDGTMVSYTSTIEGAFGSGLQFGGFYLNNELTDFDFRPVQEGTLAANRVQGGKRSRSSMAPTVVYDPEGKPFLSIGAAGGPTIPIQTARAIIGVIDFGLSLEEAIALPMIMNFGDRVIVEGGTWLEGAGPALVAMGHENVVPTGFLFRTNGAMRVENGWVAVSDPRTAEAVRVP